MVSHDFSPPFGDLFWIFFQNLSNPVHVHSLCNHFLGAMVNILIETRWQGFIFLKWVVQPPTTKIIGSFISGLSKLTCYSKWPLEISEMKCT